MLKLLPLPSAPEPKSLRSKLNHGNISLPAVQEAQETWVQSLGREDPLEKEMTTHSSILAWEIPWRGAWQATIHGVAKESDTT